MIKSLSSRDPFDAIFFFEEEFGRVNKYQKSLEPSKIKLVKDVLMFRLGNDIDLSTMEMREDVIKLNTDDLPYFKCYFIDNFVPCNNIKDFLYSNVFYKFCDVFPTLDTRYGSMFILENVFKLCYLHNLHVTFDADYKYIDNVDDKERTFIERQNNWLLSFTRIINLCSVQTYGVVELDSHICIPVSVLAIITSFKRWLKLNTNHLMGSAEFDKKVMVPWLCTFLTTNTTMNPNLAFATTMYRSSIQNNPDFALQFANYLLDLSTFIETNAFRQLDFVHRLIEYQNKKEELAKSYNLPVMMEEYRYYE